MSNFLKNSIAILIGLLIALLILEVFLRVVDPFNFVVKGNEIFLNKNITTVTKYGDTIIKKKINSLGFIGDEYEDSDNGKTKIFTIGGSTTACDALNTEDSWPEVFKRNLLDLGKNVWLNNAGFSGHSTYGHNILLRDHISKLKPDYITFLIGINDVGLSKRSLGDNVLAADRDLRSYSIWGKIYFTLTEKVYVINNILNLVRSYKAYQLNINDLDFDLENLVFAEDDIELKNILIKYHKEKYLSGYRERVKHLITQSKSAGVIPILITQPYLGGNNAIDKATGISLGKIAMSIGSSWAGVRDDWDLELEPSRKVNANAMWEVLELYNDVVREVAIQENVVLVDMAQKLEKNTEYFYDMIHFTKTGSSQFASILTNELSSKINNPANK